MVGIYKITNPKGKIYIGQSTGIEKRWKSYKRLNCKGQTKLYNSILKYSWEQHKFEILEECTLEQLNEREIYWGMYYDVLEENGLNLRLGNANGICSEETKEKLSNSLKNRDISLWKDKIYSDERNGKISNQLKFRIMSEDTKQKISKSSKGVSRNKGISKSESHKISMSKVRVGKKHSKTHINNMRKGMIGKNTTSIICINDNKIFQSIKDASKYYNILSSSIDNILSGRSKTTKNKLIFKYI